MAGELDGTDVGVGFDDDGTGTYTDIGGITTNSFTLNNGAIDITNKSSASVRTLLDGAGLQSVDLTIECVFNTDTAFQAMKTSALEKSIKGYQIDRGGETLEFNGYITSFAETSPDNDKVTASISIQSSGAITGL